MNITEQTDLSYKVGDYLAAEGYITDVVNLVEAERTQVHRCINDLFPRTGRAIMHYVETGGIHAMAWDMSNYHNIRHAMSVAMGVLEFSKTTWLSQHELRVLMLAALFHDANHTLGLMCDDINVAMAIGVVNPKLYHGAMIPGFLESHGEDWLSDIEANRYDAGTVFLKDVLSLILESKFPYNDIDTPPRLVGVFRDIDRLTVYRPDWYVQIYTGLYMETAASRDIEFTAFCKSQLTFLLSFAPYGPHDVTRFADAIRLARIVLTTAQRLSGVKDGV